MLRSHMCVCVSVCTTNCPRPRRRKSLRRVHQIRYLQLCVCVRVCARSCDMCVKRSGNYALAYRLSWRRPSIGASTACVLVRVCECWSASRICISYLRADAQDERRAAHSTTERGVLCAQSRRYHCIICGEMVWRRRHARESAGMCGVRYISRMVEFMHTHTHTIHNVYGNGIFKALYTLHVRITHDCKRVCDAYFRRKCAIFHTHSHTELRRCDVLQHFSANAANARSEQRVALQNNITINMSSTFLALLRCQHGAMHIGT